MTLTSALQPGPASRPRGAPPIRHMRRTRGGSRCWHWLSTGRCRRTGNLPITESSPQHKAAFFLLILLAQYPARVKHIPPRGSRNTLVEFPEYQDGVYERAFRACTDRGQPISLVPLCATMKPSPGWAAPREGTDMAGPSWLAGIFAAVMILTGAYSTSRLAVCRLRGRATEFDTDALHAVMGAAMAGMLVPRLPVRHPASQCHI